MFKVLTASALVILLACVNITASAQRSEVKTSDSLFLAGDYAHAKIAYKKLVNDTSKNGIWWNRMAFSYYNTGDYETALTYYRKTESYVRANNIFGAVFNLYLVMGQNFYCLKQYDSAFHYYKYLLKHTAEFFHIPPEKYGQYGKLYSRLGEVHLAFRQYDKALNYLQNALKGFKKVNDINQAMWVLLRLGNTYRETGKYNLAIDHGTELLQLANETGARQFIRDAHFLLYQLFDDLEKYEQAYWHLKKYNVIKDAIDMDRSAQKLAFYKSQFEQEKSQSTITQLNHEKKTHEQQL